MPSLLIRHKVKAYDAWKAVFDDHELTRRANGSRGGRIFRSAADPNEIVVLMEWDGSERARLFADTDDLREAMERAGVTDQPDVWVLLDGERVPV